MHKSIEKIETTANIESVMQKNSETKFFSTNELVQNKEKNKTKSLGARYLIKTSILDFFKLENYYHDIEILNNKQGKPEIIFTGEVKKKMENNSICNVQISISHSKNYIATLVILE